MRERRSAANPTTQEPAPRFGQDSPKTNRPDGDRQPGRVPKWDRRRLGDPVRAPVNAPTRIEPLLVVALAELAPHAIDRLRESFPEGLPPDVGDERLPLANVRHEFNVVIP